MYVCTFIGLRGFYVHVCVGELIGDLSSQSLGELFTPVYIYTHVQYMNHSSTVYSWEQPWAYAEADADNGVP